MAIVLLFLTGLFDRLPQPLLAALVLASVQSMFNVDELRQLLRVSKAEFLIALVTIAAVLGPRHPQGGARRLRVLARDADSQARAARVRGARTHPRSPITSRRSCVTRTHKPRPEW
jgi:hypothetical protein